MDLGLVVERDRQYEWNGGGGHILTGLAWGPILEGMVRTDSCRMVMVGSGVAAQPSFVGSISEMDD